jgi:hypothetical protein
MCGTANINALAFALLINPGGGLDQLLCGDLTSELELSFDSIPTPGFRQLIDLLRPYLEERGEERRGLMDPRLLFSLLTEMMLFLFGMRSIVGFMNSQVSIALMIRQSLVISLFRIGSLI